MSQRTSRGRDRMTAREVGAPFRALVESIPGAVYRRRAEPPWPFAYVSATIESICGYRARDLTDPRALGDGLALLPEDAPMVIQTIKDSLTSGRPYDMEYRIRHADGSVLWVHDRGQAASDDTGHVTWIDGVLFDITQRKEAERVLVEQQERLIALMDAIPDYIYFKDRDSRFMMISRALARSFGLDHPDEASGKTDADFFSEEHARLAFEDEQRIIHSGLPVIGLEEKETWPDGHETWASTTKLPRTDQAGNVIGTFGISRDITRRKLADAELADTNRRLEAPFEQATEKTLLPQPTNLTQLP